MKLDVQTTYLIAIGASVTANCRACLERNVAKARELGVEEQQIAQAVATAKMVRRCAAATMDNVAADLSEGVSLSTPAAQRGCGCDG